MNSLPWSYLGILENIRKTVHYCQQVEDAHAQQPGSRGRRHSVTLSSTSTDERLHTALTAEYVEVAKSTSKKKMPLLRNEHATFLPNLVISTMFPVLSYGIFIPGP